MAKIQIKNDNPKFQAHKISFSFNYYIMYAHAHVKSLIPTHLDNCPPTQCKALYGSGISLYSNPTDIIHPRWDYFQRKSLVDIGFLSNFAADISIMVFFLYYRCLLFFALTSLTQGGFYIPIYHPYLPPQAAPPASTVRGRGFQDGT